MSPGRDPSISSGEGLAHVLPNPSQDSSFHRNSKPAHSARHRDPQPRRRRRAAAEGRQRRGLRAGVGVGPTALSQGARARSLQESFTGKRTGGRRFEPGTLDLRKREPDPRPATNGARTRQAADNARL